MPTGVARSGCSELMIDLGVRRSHSQARCSNDNPYSAAQFKTLKYMPDFPDRFGSLADARAFCERFFTAYNHVGPSMMVFTTAVACGLPHVHLTRRRHPPRPRRATGTRAEPPAHRGRRDARILLPQQLHPLVPQPVRLQPQPVAAGGRSCPTTSALAVRQLVSSAVPRRSSRRRMGAGLPALAKELDNGSIAMEADVTDRRRSWPRWSASSRSRGSGRWSQQSAPRPACGGTRSAVVTPR